MKKYLAILAVSTTQAFGQWTSPQQQAQIQEWNNDSAQHALEQRQQFDNSVRDQKIRSLEWQQQFHRGMPRYQSQGAAPQQDTTTEDRRNEYLAFMQEANSLLESAKSENAAQQEVYQKQRDEIKARWSEWANNQLSKLDPTSESWPSDCSKIISLYDYSGEDSVFIDHVRVQQKIRTAHAAQEAQKEISRIAEMPVKPLHPGDIAFVVKETTGTTPDGMWRLSAGNQVKVVSQSGNNVVVYSSARQFEVDQSTLRILP